MNEIRLIDANILRKAFEEVYPLATNEMGGVANKRIYDLIDNAPTVELDGYVLDGTGLELVSTDYLDEQLGKDRRRGKWVEKRDDNGCLQLYCNQCGTKAQVGFISFCGKCGAKMKQD